MKPTTRTPNTFVGNKPDELKFANRINIIEVTTQNFPNNKYFDDVLEGSFLLHLKKVIAIPMIINDAQTFISQ